MPRGSIAIPIPVPTGGERGDLPDNKVDANSYRLLQNMMLSRNGGLAMRNGYRELASTGPATRIMGLVYWRNASDSTNRTVAATRTGLWRFDGTSWADITGGTVLNAATTDIVRFEVFSTSGAFSAIAGDGGVVPQTWDGAAATFTDLGGSPPVAVDVSAAANRFLLLINPDNIRISAFNDPATWPAGLTVRLPDRGDIKIGMERLGRLAVGIYGEESQWVGRAQRGSFPFRFEKIDEKPGPLSKGCIIGDGRVNYYLGTDGITYRFDGTACRPISLAMEAFVVENLNHDNKAMAHGWLDSQRRISWVFPSASSTAPNLGVYLDLNNMSMGRLSYNNITASARWGTVALVTWDDLTSFTWDTVAATFSSWTAFGQGAARGEIVGDVDGQVHAVSQGAGSDNGGTIDAVWELPLRAWAGDDKNFIPDTFETYFKQTANSATIRPGVKVTDTLMTEPTVTTLDTIDIQTDQRNDLDLSGVAPAGGTRFLSVRQQVLTTLEPVTWVGGVLYGEGRNASGGPTSG